MKEIRKLIWTELSLLLQNVVVVVSCRYCCYCSELLLVSRLLLLLPGGASVVLRTSKPQENNYCWIMNPSSKFSFLINDGSSTDHT